MVLNKVDGLNKPDREKAIVPPGTLSSALEIEGLRQEFKNRRGGDHFVVDVERLSLPRGGFVSIQGPNGCGKTTLVTVLALLRRPYNIHDLGSFRMRLPQGAGLPDADIDIKKLWLGWRQRSEINNIRRKCIGFAPQQLELLPALKVHETIASSLWLNEVPAAERHKRVEHLLQQFGLLEAKVARHRINRISGGQQQKTTLARAVAHRPSLIFLDEPTAYLFHRDAEEALRVLQDLQAESAEQGKPITVVMITHDKDLAKKFATFNVTMTVRNLKGRREGCIIGAE